MKRAGMAAFNLIQEIWPQTELLHIVCGSGNNGGDGYIVAGIAQQKGLKTMVWQMSPTHSDTAQQAFKFAQDNHANIQPFNADAYQQSIHQSDTPNTVIVDALLGIGFHGSLKEDYATAIDIINSTTYPIVSLDIASGIDSDTGHVASNAINAHHTISFIAHKIGTHTGAGVNHSGTVSLASLGIPEDIKASNKNNCITRLDLQSLLHLLPTRQKNSHKGNYGHALVVGGNEGMGGAGLMAAQMAARSGAGLVALATHPAHSSSMIAFQPEIMMTGVASGQVLRPLLSKPNVLIVGPGLGQSAWSEQLFYQCIHADKSLVLDADALNLLSARQIQWPDNRDWVITPHPGEAARLLNISVTEVEADRPAAAKALQSLLGPVTVVLKGAGTLIVDRQGQLSLCRYGNPGMASGGMGDVLSGLIGSLMAQGFSADIAAQLGVCLHACAADHAIKSFGEQGLLATDLIPLIPQLMAKILNA